MEVSDICRIVSNGLAYMYLEFKEKKKEDRSSIWREKN